MSQTLQIILKKNSASNVLTVQFDLKEQMQNLGQFSTAFPRTQILYRGYSIHKRSFPPSIIFYIIMEETKEIHILRVLRHERDWENILLQRSTYTYPE